MTKPPLRIAHPFADLLPLMNSLDFEELVGDISKNGQLEEATVDEHGRIMDGRNRVAACDRLGIEPKFETWQGKPGTEADFIFAKNLVRRHLNEVQKAEIAEKLATAKRGGRAPGPNLALARLTQPQAAQQVGSTVENEVIAMAIKCVNAMHTGDRPKQIRWRSTGARPEPMPELAVKPAALAAE